MPSLPSSDELFRGAPEWTWPAVAIVLILGLVLVWAYSRANVSSGVRTVAALLKLTAVILLAICLLEPMRSGTRPRPHANIMPVLVDNSQSMRLKDSTNDQTRRDHFAAMLDDKSSWRTRLAQSFDVRDYAFDVRLQSVDGFAELSADGDVSSMAGSLTSLSDRFSDKPVAGALLFSDGNLTDAPAGDFDWGTLGFPIYPIVPRDEGEIRDLRIVDVGVRQTDFESAPTTVSVRFDAVGMDDQEVIVQLRSHGGADDGESDKNKSGQESKGNKKSRSAGKVVEEQTARISADGEPGQVTFRFRPEKPGVNFHTVSVFSKRDREAVEGEEEANSYREATLLNNSRVIAINRASGPYRILYLAGRPNWEFKFLRRALEEEAEVQLVGLIRIAKEEPKFTFREQGVNETNPLFAGLGDDEEEAAQQYDEPVIVRLGVKESEELSDGFPESAEELFAYHGVILDDIENEFFTQDQMLLLRRFVGSRGGGLLMLGGTESFASKKFGESPLGELAPIYPRRSGDERSPGPYQLTLSREGLLQPWVRLRETESAEQDRLLKMRPFKTLNPVGDVKPGATELATVTTGADRSEPAMVAQRFGKGRTGAILIGDLWRWSMKRDDRERDDPGQAWRQLTRWLVNDVPRRAEVSVEPGNDPSQGVEIVARARDESYLPLDNAKVELTVTPPEGESFTLQAEMDETEAGTYRATCWSRDPGGYLVEASFTAADGSDVGTARTGWTAQPAAAEFADLRWNRQLLEDIAEQTGGQLVYDDEIDEFVAELPSRKVPVTETWVYPIWHRPWVLLAALMCLCCEWGLRRWKGLA